MGHFTMRKSKEHIIHCQIQYYIWVVFILLGMFFFPCPLSSLFSQSCPKQRNKRCLYLLLCLSSKFLSGELIIAYDYQAPFNGICSLNSVSLTWDNFLVKSFSDEYKDSTVSTIILRPWVQVPWSVCTSDIPHCNLFCF